MRGVRVYSVVLTALLVTSGLFMIQMYEIKGDDTPKAVYARVLPNSTTGEVAYPGTSVFYIQNRTIEGMGIYPMQQAAGEEWMVMDMVMINSINVGGRHFLLFLEEV